MQFQNVVECTLKFVKVHSLAAPKRSESAATRTGVRLKDIKNHHKSNIPSSKEPKKTWDTVHQLTIVHGKTLYILEYSKRKAIANKTVKISISYLHELNKGRHSHPNLKMSLKNNYV